MVTGKDKRIKSAEMPRALPEFEHIKRYWDNSRAQFAAKILPGEYYVTRTDELIVTVLGSCISACIRDPSVGVGGMNHFMLPMSSNTAGSWDADGLGASTRYGNYAMERLINDILKNGGSRRNLEVKAFGGGRMLAHMSDIGKRNADFIRAYLETEGIRLRAEDFGDVYPRKVCYSPVTGRVLIKKLRTLRNDTLLQRERAYLDEIEHRPVQGEITLF
ncbi:MAG: chemoreceptor glutamine deamidase CheD [Gammaproteobacteria bacterium]|nr:chemoreceptor glutamine deamidase CheD [Gammaproteobacteria bacterium]